MFSAASPTRMLCYIVYTVLKSTIYETVEALETLPEDYFWLYALSNIEAVS